MHLHQTALLGALVLASTLGPAQAAFPPPLSSYYPDVGPNASIVFELHEGAGVGLIGLLTREATASVKRILDKNARIEELVIDSQGGDVDGAIALAELVRERKLRLVVAGRCFSACANFVFTAARRKDVLPGSLVGIHGKTYSYAFQDKPLMLRSSDSKQIVAASGDPSAAAQVAAFDKAERTFYRNIGVSMTYLDDFERYSAAYRSAPAASCPALEFWILRRKDLEKMGVTGMGAIWEPLDRAAAGAAGARFGFNPKTMFLGDPAALAAQCRPASGFMAKLRGLFG